MTKLLLDFPWRLDSVFDPNSDAAYALRDFTRLCEKDKLEAVSFVAEADYFALFDRSRSNVFRPALQILGNYVRDADTAVRAAPVAGPDDLPDQWKFGLADELSIDEWRTPQIIAYGSRRDAWQRSLIGTVNKTEAIFEREGDGQRYSRVFVILGVYDRHLYARSDRVPWDLQRRRLPEPGAPKHQQHPCALPIPPALEKVEFENLKSAAEQIHNWEIGGKYYFLPGDGWQPNDIDEAPWRAGHTFPHARCPHCGKEWPIDRKKQIWCWDKTHRHWDVQLIGTEYWSISHDGTLIKKKRKSKKSKKGWRGRRAR